ncbi:hypothetical protein [Nocardiopsis alba]|uniref:hypothetical protein n=1 Tax=Nocardiopsis alba TaxID=53437 RepID=UPI0033AC2A78
MGVTAKLALYVVGLVVVFAAAFGAGTLAGPVLPDGGDTHAEGVEGTPPGGQDQGPEDLTEH